MDNVTIILSSLISLALVIWIAPNIFALNRGRALRNIALWLAIFMIVGLMYKHMGPGQNAAAPDSPHAATQDADKDDSDESADQPSTGYDPNQGYTPPKE